MENLSSLRTKAKALDPVVRIGKSGLQEGVIKEIIMHLRKRKLIKIKLLGNFSRERSREEMREFLQKLQQETQSTLVSYVGNSIVLYKNAKN